MPPSDEDATAAKSVLKALSTEYVFERYRSPNAEELADDFWFNGHNISSWVRRAQNHLAAQCHVEKKTLARRLVDIADILLLDDVPVVSETYLPFMAKRSATARKTLIKFGERNGTPQSHFDLRHLFSWDNAPFFGTSQILPSQAAGQGFARQARKSRQESDAARDTDAGKKGKLLLVSKQRALSRAKGCRKSKWDGGVDASKVSQMVSELCCGKSRLDVLERFLADMKKSVSLTKANAIITAFVEAIDKAKVERRLGITPDEDTMALDEHTNSLTLYAKKWRA
ncbi:hypothetical protein BDZ88DRAFT_441916 [Geranomyces variabilis]|nr:hypothetical protein BDZ88DRAFT_441916 [Geranomyces variabilis]